MAMEEINRLDRKGEKEMEEWERSLELWTGPLESCPHCQRQWETQIPSLVGTPQVTSQFPTSLLGIHLPESAIS